MGNPPSISNTPQSREPQHPDAPVSAAPVTTTTPETEVTIDVKTDDVETDDVETKATPNTPESANDLKTLQTLILGGSPEDVLHPAIDVDDLSQVLPEAMARAHQQGPELLIATLPTVESAIASSVQTDAHVLATALFPVIGPATRQSITSAIGNLVQSLNQTLDYSLSPRSLKWRWEAFRTGKSFAEVVLIRTLIYRVEQLFLIHRDTGLVIQHKVADEAIVKDPDLVSAMLTAIQDFIQDSFEVDAGDAVNSLKLGDVTLLVEAGPTAILAGVIRGTPPHDLSELLRSQLEKIHLHFGPKLHEFDGNPDKWSILQPYLEDCLHSQFKQTKSSLSSQKTPAEKSPLSRTQKRLMGCLIMLVLIGLGSGFWLNWQSNRHWQQFVHYLQTQPGLVVISQHKHRGTYYLQGLQDPLAPNPNQLLKEFKLKPEKVDMTWSGYLSLEPAFLADRTELIFNAPATVEMTLEEDGGLRVAGEAPSAWINQAKKLSEQISGITAWQDSELTSAEARRLNQLQARITHRRFRFQIGAADLRSRYFQTRYLETLQNQATDIASLLQIAQDIDQPVTLTITAHGDQLGASEATLQLAQTRANRLKRYLVEQGIPAQAIQAMGRPIIERNHTGIEQANTAGVPALESPAAYFSIQP